MDIMHFAEKCPFGLAFHNPYLGTKNYKKYEINSRKKNSQSKFQGYTNGKEKSELYH